MHKTTRSIIACLCGLFLAGHLANAVIYPTRSKGSTMVRIHEQQLMPETNGSQTGGPGHVTAKYADLIQKAIVYKQQYPGETVEIRFAMYIMSYSVYIGYNPAHESYMRVSNTDFGGAHSEKLINSFCRAAQAGVIVKMILHKSGETGVDLSVMTNYLDTNGGPNLQYRVVNWGSISDNQMHNKFLLVNKTRAGSSNYHSIVYVTSANIDEWRAWGPKSSQNKAQTGVLLYQNSGVYNAYKNYFDNGLWPHAADTSPTAFRATMASLHAAGLNYPEDADGISAYFYPVSDSQFWHVNYNPSAKIFNTINTNSAVTAPYIKCNMGYMRFHVNAYDFAARYMDAVRTMASVHNINLASSSVANAMFVVMNDDNDGDDYAPIASNRLSLNQPSHSKNYMFAFNLSGTAYMYSAGGSTNGAFNDYTRKANNIIMIRELTAANREVYQDFYDIFYYAFNY